MLTNACFLPPIFDIFVATSFVILYLALNAFFIPVSESLSKLAAGVKYGIVFLIDSGTSAAELILSSKENSSILGACSLIKLLKTSALSSILNNSDGVKIFPSGPLKTILLSKPFLPTSFVVYSNRILFALSIV